MTIRCIQYLYIYIYSVEVYIYREKLAAQNVRHGVERASKANNTSTAY